MQMSIRNVVVYISNNCTDCDNLLNQMDSWNVPYEIINISEKKDEKEKLQEMGVYGTPATFIGDGNKAILGFQKNKLKNSLNVRNED